ncbi:MAG: inorganic phosphate transporter, partial [Oleibacter sp.]|nr:inorganic phosphate transporter [Thalassolituus sp.]
ALGAGLTVFLATKIGMPISTTHALVGALSGISWLEVAHTQREQLLAELDSLEQMERLFA